MRYIIDITPNQAKEIQKHLEKGHYGTLSQFLSTAIENQLALEENEVSELIPYKSTQFVSEMTTKNIQNSFEKFGLASIPEYVITIAAPGFSNLVYASQNIPENLAWIWGQINKIFPVKVGLRILHQLLATRGPVELNEFLEIVAKEAALIGNKLREHEKLNNKIRGEKISPALPSSDEKSMTRYKFQFMVYLRKDKLLDGAMALMQFCNIYEEKKKQMIGLTEAGLKFSLIRNPLLDENNFEKSLSEEERMFYINHCRENVKGEYEAIQWMLDKISKGKKEREMLNTEIENTFQKTWNATTAVINTQRAGITARMFELGLIEKEKDGIYVKYDVSEIGKKLF